MFVPLVDLCIPAARLAYTRQVAFYVGHKNRHAALAEAFGDPLQRNGFTGAGRPGDHAVAICHICKQQEFSRVLFCYENWFCHKNEKV